MKKLFLIPLISCLTLFITFDVNAACTNLFDVESFYSGNMDLSSTVVFDTSSISFSDVTSQVLPRFSIKGLEASTSYKISFDVEYSESDPRYALETTTNFLSVGYQFSVTSGRLSSFTDLSSVSTKTHLTHFETEFITSDTLTSTSYFNFTIYSQTSGPIKFYNFKLYKSTETCEDEVPVEPDPPTEDTPSDDPTGESVAIDNTYLILISAILMLIFITNFIKSCFRRRL